MIVSIVNLNLVGPDAMGQSILNQVRFFQQRGDTVRLFVQHPPQQVPPDVVPLVQVTDLATLIARRDAHFAASELMVYHYPSHYPLVESIRGIERGKVILFYHNVTPPELWVGSDGDRDHLANSRRQVALLLPYADRIVTPSGYNADELVTEFGADPARVRVLPLAVRLEEFAPRPADPALRARLGLDQKQVLLFVGRMAGNKRIDLLIEALALLRDRYPDLHLLLAGDDESNEGIRETVAAARDVACKGGVSDRVHFAGPVEEVAPLFHLAALYVSASLHEGFGVPLIEAMAAGVPIVASRAAAHPWVMGDAGLLVEPNDAAAIAEAITQLLDHRELYERAVEVGMDRVQQYTLERFEEGWAEIVDELTADLPPSLPIVLAAREGAPSAGDAPRDTLDATVNELIHTADTMARGYRVRSGVPVVGPLIGWIRRNLTSHLREPYIDPTFERQALFNQKVAGLLAQLVSQRRDAAALDHPIHQLEVLSHDLRQHSITPEQRDLLDQVDQALLELREANMGRPQGSPLP